MFGGQAQQQGLFGTNVEQAQQGLFGPSQSAFGGQCLFGPSSQTQWPTTQQDQQGVLGGAVSSFGSSKDPDIPTFPELFETKDSIYACTSDANHVVYVGDASGNLYAKSARNFESAKLESALPRRSESDCNGITAIKTCAPGKVVVTTASKAAYIWDINTNNVVEQAELGQALARHSSPTMLFAGSWDKTVKCRDLRVNNKDAWKIDLLGKCHALDVVGDRLLYVAVTKQQSDSAVCVYDARNPSRSIRTVVCPSPVRAISASQSRVVFGTDRGDLIQATHEMSNAVPTKTQNVNTANIARAVINQLDWSTKDDKVVVATTAGLLLMVDKDFKVRHHKALVSSAPLTAVSTGNVIVVCKSYNWHDGGLAMRQGTTYKHNQVLILRKT